jgi:Fe2+ transport system protein FeoA
MTSLAELPVGTRARVIEIGGERAFRRRLMEMGLLPGTEIRVVRHARVGGLVQLLVRGCNLSLRHSEASALMLQTG